MSSSGGALLQFGLYLPHRLLKHPLLLLDHLPELPKLLPQSIRLPPKPLEQVSNELRHLGRDSTSKRRDFGRSGGEEGGKARGGRVGEERVDGVKDGVVVAAA